MPTFKQNDILVNGKDKCKVLGVCGDVVFISLLYNMEIPDGCLYAQKELEADGWTLEEKKWEPKPGEYYHVIDNGRLYLMAWAENEHDLFRKLTGNCFPNTDEGRKAAEAYKAKLIKVMGGGE